MRDKMEFGEFVDFKMISVQFKAFIAEFVLVDIEESCIDPMVEGLKSPMDDRGQAQGPCRAFQKRSVEGPVKVIGRTAKEGFVDCE